jgi:hypothetical protein
MRTVGRDNRVENDGGKITTLRRVGYEDGVWVTRGRERREAGVSSSGVV